MHVNRSDAFAPPVHIPKTSEIARQIAVSKERKAAVDRLTKTQARNPQQS